jgi:hypothetical protein
MKKIGFLSFGHWTPSSQSQTRSAADTLLQAIDLAVAAQELGADGAYFRVHQRVFKVGLIEFDGTAVNCVVRNLSLVGAGLHVDQPVIPHCFTLNIPSSNMRQSRRVIWRKQKRIGLVFEQVA